MRKSFFLLFELLPFVVEGSCEFIARQIDSEIAFGARDHLSPESESGWGEEMREIRLQNDKLRKLLASSHI